MWLKKLNFTNLFNLLYKTGFTYSTPTNLNAFWNFGIYALVCLVVQVLTGLFLSMHYVANINIAFVSVEHIMRDVNYGWLLRYTHANGASMFFLVTYFHIFRGLYYNSYRYPRQSLWIVGVLLLFLMIIIAFTGYVLPWGQMSFWAATVITNLFSAIPFYGKIIVVWLWGGYSIDNATLSRFYSLHFFLPFILIFLIFLHLIFLHEVKSNNPLGIIFVGLDKVPFLPQYVIKDLFGTIIFFSLFLNFIFFNANFLSHSDNYIPANALVTPIHIVPEWYFLPFYAISRSIPDKLFGVIMLVFAILILIILPFLGQVKILSINFRPLKIITFFIFVFTTILLGWIGGKTMEFPYIFFGNFLTILYFVYLIFDEFIILKIENIFFDKWVTDKLTISYL